MRSDTFCIDCNKTFDFCELRDQKCPHCNSDNWSYVPEPEKGASD